MRRATASGEFDHFRFGFTADAAFEKRQVAQRAGQAISGSLNLGRRFLLSFLPAFFERSALALSQFCLAAILPFLRNRKLDSVSEGARRITEFWRRRIN